LIFNCHGDTLRINLALLLAPHLIVRSFLILRALVTIRSLALVDSLGGVFRFALVFPGEILVTDGRAGSSLDHIAAPALDSPNYHIF
jgi:hypothetical protein